MKIIDVIAWNRKYFNVLSVEYFLFFFSINGINDIKLISRANHLVNQELVETMIMIENIKEVIKSRLAGWRNIFKLSSL